MAFIIVFFCVIALFENFIAKELSVNYENSALFNSNSVTVIGFFFSLGNCKSKS